MEWVTVYTDASSSEGKRRAGIGVAIRAGEKRILTVAKPIGYCEPLGGELIAICTAIRLAKRHGLSMYDVITDSKFAIDAIRGNHNLGSPRVMRISKYIRGRLNQLAVGLRYIEREANGEADNLAKLAAHGYWLFVDERVLEDESR